MNVVQTNVFLKQAKKLHVNQKKILDSTIRMLIENPLMGEKKKGDLDGVRVYKFRIDNQLTLLAYAFNELEQQLILMTLGSHENFYRDLKR